MIVATAVAIVIVVMMVMLVVVATAVAIVIVVVMVMLVVVARFQQLLLKGFVLGHSLRELFARQRIPRGGDDGRFGVLGAHHLDGGMQFFVGDIVGAAEHNRRGRGDLVIEKLAEILAVQAAFGGVCHGHQPVDMQAVIADLLNGAHDVGQLADARRLDQNTVGGIGVQHFRKRLTEIAHQRATDTARVHLVDLDTRVFEKAAVDTDLAKLILDQHELFALPARGEQFFDQRGLACAEKSRKNSHFGHSFCLFSNDQTTSRIDTM